jgi:hypothetical protein
LYPFLNTVSRHRPFEYLRLTSLGVIGALVKVDDSEIVNFLLQTEIIPLCLRIMETGTELSKTVATFIVQKILLDDAGLTYICSTAERFYALNSVLANMVAKLVETPSARLLKHIVRCYSRLSENIKARDALRQCLPDPLKDSTFVNSIIQEDTVQRWLASLIKNINEPLTVIGTTAVTAPGIILPAAVNPASTTTNILTAIGSATINEKKVIKPGEPGAVMSAPPALPKPIGLPGPPGNLVPGTTAGSLGLNNSTVSGFPNVAAKQQPWGN